jgi:hypothetical protein
VLFVALRPLENNPLPGWDHPVSPCECCGMWQAWPIPASVKRGLKEDGIHCVALLLTALLAARMLSRPIRDRTPAA